MDRVTCETELSCNDIFRDCDPLVGVWQQCFEGALPPPVEAACDIEYGVKGLRLTGGSITSRHYHADVPAAYADDLPFEVDICDRKLDFGYGVDGFPNYWADITKCIYINADESGGALLACDVPPSFFEVDDRWTVVDNDYGSGARDVDQRFAGCTTHNPADWPTLAADYPMFEFGYPTGIEVRAGSVQVPCGFNTFASDQGGSGYSDGRSGSVRIRYTVPTFVGFE
jgi:hypothetical protein